MSARSVRRPWLRIVLAFGVGLTLIWILWTERQPEHEAWLRSEAQARLQSWFPEAMQPRDSEIGFDPAPSVRSGEMLVVLIHGLDEPGGIFDQLSTALEQRGHAHTRFLYPNDQSISDSTDLLARHWTGLPADQPVVLLGHSMGGLLIRDFVTRSLPQLGPDAAIVTAALLIGTPNQGSDWARLRVWLELRDLAGSGQVDDFGLFAGLRDGTGAAKVDLRPGSRFLKDLNERRWPEEIPLRVLGGEISIDPEQRTAGLETLKERTGDTVWSQRFLAWLDDTAARLGDGVVDVDSLPAPGAPPPDIVSATHRGLLKSGPLSDEDPPGIEWTLQQIERLSNEH